jgi:hypothetical protein
VQVKINELHFNFFPEARRLQLSYHLYNISSSR